ncbi:immunoglobulin superfamily member 6 isoform X2 [Kryptolebias marmoratus]|uniref:immunoglobulin superfamily member 6 isoform X2 n=1 Tax=Kryptolebias marmoratus TaxID=37003 RepID=UPI0007F92C7E|nr:immunoglobulin superfamily member 6 isoform X2 [Kryptolebias marmoratus]
MKGLFWLLLLLTHLCGTESTEKEESCLFQPREVIFNKTEESAVLFCNVSNCHHQNLDYQWFVFRENYHCRVSETTRYRLKGASLQIRSLNANDSGVYLCAVKSRSEEKCCRPHVGLGTTLVVRERVKIMKTHVILWLFFALLAIYSLTLVALIILKKHGCEIPFCKQTSRTDTAVQGSVRKKTQFRDVLQELHSRGNFNKSKQTRRNNSRVEEASGESNVSTDDIYQNV